MLDISKDISIVTLNEDDFNELYWDIMAFATEKCALAGEKVPKCKALSDKILAYDFTDLPEPIQDEIEQYEQRLGEMLYLRGQLLYSAAHHQCYRAVMRGETIENILSKAQHEAPALLDQEDPFGYVEESSLYRQMQEDLQDFDFSDLPHAVILKIWYVTYDILEEQNYLSALIYYMGIQNALRMLGRWGAPYNKIQ